ncbi:type II toxin-antitoxin system VapC family toxin [Membranihabitans maritimus]|uniref:type II toxin-antitoxin system VapC family toxin n=1 Tax=Membranihabitans maritimus TaxID=2904244 RepID=UPI001F3A4355|nr:type II toxin-antitoxin system VapC family toxin [Membranihabitans maritimus]
MTYLTDTHSLIWSVLQPGKLSRKVREILENPAYTISVSAVNFWKISLKYSIGKLELKGILPQEFPQIVLQMGFLSIPLTPVEAVSYHNLNGNRHKDPFDKMLIWQAMRHDFTFIRKDKNVMKYEENGLKVVW